MRGDIGEGFATGFQAKATVYKVSEGETYPDWGDCDQALTSKEEEDTGSFSH